MARLGDVCNIKSGYAFKSEMFTKNEIPIIRIGNITENGLEIDNDICFDESFWNKNKNYRINKDDVLVAMSGATVGKSCINKHSNKLLLNQRVASISGKNGVENKYVYYFVSSPAFMDYILEQSVGCAQPNISIKQLCAIEFYLPNLKEQKEIVGKLDKVYNLIALRREQLSKLDELVKARFVEMFGLPVSNTMNWETEKMQSIAPSQNYLGEMPDEVWLLNLDMIESQTGRIIDYLIVPKDEVGNSTCVFDDSTVLYSKLRPYLNKVVIPNRCGYATSELVPLKPNSSKLNREYLAYMLRSDEFVTMISEKVAGAKMPRVSMNDFRDFEVPIPPIELQNEFAAFVEQTDKSKFDVQQSLEKLEILKKSLMQQYFG